MDKTANKIYGNKRGRVIAPENTESIHKSQWYPEHHPGTSQVPYLISPLSITEEENAQVRRIWESSDYQGKDFSAPQLHVIPNKYKLAQILACGLKATCATYSQHWEGMYFDWTFNSQLHEIFNDFGKMIDNERIVENSFATVVLLNTGYKGAFLNMLKWRRRPIPPSMLSLENIDMGTFECNLKTAICAVLGGNFGVNIIRKSLTQNLISSINKKGYEALKHKVIVDGMNPDGKIASIMQIGFKQPEDRKYFDSYSMNLAGAKLIERKSERRNVDFSLEVPRYIMDRFNNTVKEELREFGVEECVKFIVLEGSSDKGKAKLEGIRSMIHDGLDSVPEAIIKSYEENIKDGTTDLKKEEYDNMAHLIAELGKKVLKPREDSQKMIFLYADMIKIKGMGLSVELVEHAAGSAIQAGLNSIHLDGTTNVPEADDLKYGAFCLTGPIHSAEILDTDEQINRGWGNGFWDILASELPKTNKMLALVAISAKREQDAMIAEKQAMEQRKSVNDIFWYKTWNHPEGKKLDVPNWISYSHVLNVLPITGNDILVKDDNMPDQMPANHSITREFLSKNT